MLNYKLPTVLAVFMALLVCFSCEEPEKDKKTTRIDKPNVILIMTDDQGWGDLGFNGNTNLQTPNIDALGAQGVSFENFYVQPVCSPTRAELLTGRHYTRLGVYDTSAGGERFNLGETTIAEIFKENGYQTAAYGKWHSGSQPPYHPNSRGFDDYYGFTSGHWGNYFSPMLEHNGKIVKGNGFLVDDLTNHGIDFITKNQNSPFFLYLPLNTPHSPMQVPDEYWNRFAEKDLERKYQGQEKEDSNFTKAALAMVVNIDHNVGRIVTHLRKLNIEENTIVIFMSDNGPNSWRWNGGMRGRKGSTDEGGVRTPFFMQWKNNFSPGKKVPQIASAIDILPTLASLVDIEFTTEKPIDGVDLSPLITKIDTPWNDRFIYSHWNKKTSVRNQEYRLDFENRLYHLPSDIGQKNDISKNKPALRDSMIAKKNKWLSATIPTEKLDRPFPIGHPDYTYSHIPARDGVAHGNINRSNRWPNDSFFMNWKSEKDSITWNTEVLADGKFEVELYYTLKQENKGVSLELSIGENNLTKNIVDTHDPPLKGEENDRHLRGESYVKEFKPVVMGTMQLTKGRNTLVLKASQISGKEAIDFRLLTFKRLSN